MPSFKFQKEEKLKSTKIIGKLFSIGQSYGVYPLRLVWMELNEKKGPYPIKFALSVPKRAFSKAVKRNRIKRLIRESWRLNKHWLYDKIEDEKQYAFMVIYIGKEELPLPKIEEAVRKMNRRFVKKVLNVPKQEATKESSESKEK